MIVRKCSVCDTYIADILDNYRVSDIVSDLNILSWICCLGDTQLSSCILCSYCSCCLDLVRILAAYRCRVRFDDIHDTACVDIILCYLIGVLEGCLFIWCKCECLSRKICVIVRKCSVCDTYIADVLDCYGVSDRVTDRNTGCRFCCLGNAQLSSCCLSRNCSCCRYLCRFVTADCCCIRFDDVHYLARINIILCHCICVSEGCLFVRSELE